MADDDSPRPFNRARNLSNRNFAKCNSTRRYMRNNSIHITSQLKNVVDATTIHCQQNSIPKNSKISDCVLDRKPQLKMSTMNIDFNDDNVGHAMASEPNDQQGATSLPTNPFALRVIDRVLKFENLQVDPKQVSTKSTKALTTSDIINNNNNNNNNKNNNVTIISINDTMGSQSSKGFTAVKQMSIEEEAEEDNLEEERSILTKKLHKRNTSKTYIKVEQTSELPPALEQQQSITNESDEMDNCKDQHTDRSQYTESSVCGTPPIAAALNTALLMPAFKHSISHSAEHLFDDVAEKKQDFTRNFRSNPRPKTEIIGLTIPRFTDSHKFNSLHKIKANDDEVEDEEAIQLRDKGVKSVEPILEELIKTEETYVESLWTGINNYAPIFERKDLPAGLRGKKYVLLGNVEQLAEFHRDEFLPMLRRNRHDLKRIFEEFIQFIDENCFYGYVLFTINKKRSLKLCDIYKNYFKMVQSELDDKLGINSFLVQPIQRMARYPLLLQQFITTLFKNRDYDMKPIIESCCRLEKRLRNLLTITNESEIINDIVCLNEASDFNVLHQGKFRKVSEFHVYDHTRKRSYRSKVFMFDMCIVYTEIKGKQLLYQGRYPCEHIGITAKTKSFTLYYDQRKQQECDFSADQSLVEAWLELIREMITAYAAEERRKIKELHAREHGDSSVLGQPPNLSLFRDSNRFSSDSGIGNIWVLPKPDLEEVAATNRTTWYAVT